MYYTKSWSKIFLHSVTSSTEQHHWKWCLRRHWCVWALSFFSQALLKSIFAHLTGIWYSTFKSFQQLEVSWIKHMSLSFLKLYDLVKVLRKLWSSWKEFPPEKWKINHIKIKKKKKGTEALSVSAENGWAWPWPGQKPNCAVEAGDSDLFQEGAQARWHWKPVQPRTPGTCTRVKLSKFNGVLFSSVTQLCPTLCDPMNHSMPGLPVHHQLPEFTQTHVHRVGDAIQPSHPLSFSSPPALNLSQHQGLASHF